MTSRIRLIPWVVGVGLVGATLLGANHLLQSDAPKAGAAPAVAPTGAAGVTVLGTVASDPPESPVGPPAVAGLMTVATVFVREGQAVKAGDPLVQFDDALVKPKLAQAEAAVKAARELVAKAQVQKQVHAVQVEGQQIAVETADAEVRRADDSVAIARRDYNKYLDAPNVDRRVYTEAEKQAKQAENLDIRQAESSVNVLRAKAAGERKKLDGLKLTPVDADIRAAAAQVEQAEGAVADARANVDACLVKARLAGTIEQVSAAPGMTYGPAERRPVLWLIPAGKRVVRAEVEAEFAFRVADKAGRPVTVYDATNFGISYPGVVKEVGTAYLPKRSAGDGFALHPVKVLECLIEVPDPAPAGKSPLRVGQPVRVSFQ